MQGGPEIRMVQALRAAACLMVVLYHVLQAAPRAGWLRAWPNGSAGVDLFFVISGYVMLRSSRGLIGERHGWRRFLRRRVRRVVPLYWLLTGIKLAVTLARPGLTPQTHPGVWTMAASLLFIPARDAFGVIRPVLPVGWSLNFEFFFYLLFAAALAARWHPLWLSPVLLAVAVAGFWRTPMWPAPFFLANGMVLEFVAGMLISYKQKFFGSFFQKRTAFLLLSGGAVFLLVLPLAGPWRCLDWGLPAAAILVGSIRLEPLLGPRVPAWLLAIGDASYAIYLVHPFVVPAVHGVVAVPVSIAAGLLVHRMVDAPLQRWLARGGRATLYGAAGGGVLSG